MQFDINLSQSDNVILNPFQEPRVWRRRIIDTVDIPSTLNFSHPGFICALVTSRCHIGCEHCMFSSSMTEGRLPTNTMTPQRVQALLKLVEESNTGYFLVSGGGEGFLELPLMYQIIEGSTADVTWMVSSGFWANTDDNARSILKNCYDAHLRGNIKKPHRETIIRISVDEHHVERIGSSQDRFDYIRRIVKVFEEYYFKTPNFSLMLHAIEEEGCLIEKLSVELKASIHTGIDVKHSAAKVTQRSVFFHFQSGFELPVTYAKLLLSDITVDMRDEESLAKRIRIWETDAYINEHNQPGLQIHNDGYGNDMLVIYDGRVAGGWQCEMPDVQINVDYHDYAEIMRLTLSDPGVLATLEKGLKYRFSVIDEVNPKASTRAKAVNIRDYTSPTLLEEDRDKLYFTIRSVQDYRKEGRLRDNKLTLASDILSMIDATPAQLRSWYYESQYDIIAQFRDFIPGFPAFETALHDFVINDDIEIFTAKVLEAGNHEMRRIAQWHQLMLRIHHEWYNITNWNQQLLAILKKVIIVLEKYILKGKHPFEGLSRQSMR